MISKALNRSLLERTFWRLIETMMFGKELAFLLPDWLCFIRDSVHESTSSSCSHAAQHNTAGRPFIYYEIAGHRVNRNSTVLTDWVVHRTTALAWPNLLTLRAQWHAEPGPCILTLLLFGFHFPCSGLPRVPFSLALPPLQVHTFQILPRPRRFSAPVSNTRVVQLQNPSRCLPSSETFYPHWNLHIPTGHDSCAAFFSFFFYFLLTFKNSYLGRSLNLY